MKKIFLVFVIFIVSCNNNSTEKEFDKLDKLNWLIGNWGNKMPDGLLVEKWKKENDSTFIGKSFFINTKDTVHYESIILTQNADELIYSATVTGQNNNEPVDFKLTSETENEFTFENPNHDYPQKITYKKVSDDSLVATISGIQQGKVSQESFGMKKK